MITGEDYFCAPHTRNTEAGGPNCRQTGGEGAIVYGGGLCDGNCTLTVDNVWGCQGEPQTSESAYQR